MKSKIGRMFAALGAFAAAACGTTAGQPDTIGQGPALWKLADADTTIYLFGTIHLLPEGKNWRTPVLEQAIAASNELVLEIDADDNPMAAAQLMAKIGMSPGLPPLVERVPAEKRDELDKVLKESGLPLQALNRMETWAASLMLMGYTFKQMGLNPELGVEKGLTSTYKAQTREISGLETVEEQLGFFDNLSEASQRVFLEGVLDDPAKAKAEFEAMMNEWITGDVDGIARTFDTELKKTPELYNVLIRERNQRWAERIAGMLDEPGTRMVAVGAGHLAGSDSVQRLLAKKGLKVQRLQ